MGAASPDTAAPWHALDVATSARRLATDLESGLSEAEAGRRLTSLGRNELEVEEGPSRLRILLSQFNDVLIWLLIGAAVVSGAFLSEWVDTGVIVAIVVLNAVLGYVQESRAEEALAALKELTAPQAIVIRDGIEGLVPSAELVPGDLIVLEAGDRVPADARVIDSVHMEAEEASLTGESFPVGKQANPVGPDAGMGDQSSMVFGGTTIAAGRGRAIVAETGPESAMGRIAAMLSAEEPATPLEVELGHVGKRLTLIAVGTAVVVFGVGLARGNEAESMLLIAVALAVAAIPEGLPAVVTITLSRGVTRMAEENAIVRRLTAVEALGAATVVCTDKTGTLTRNEIRVQQLRFAGAEWSLTEAPSGDERVEMYGIVAALCNDARIRPEGYAGDPTEVALLASLEGLSLNGEAIRGAYPRVDELAFDSTRKRMATLHRSGGDYFLAVKGAPEIVSSRCTSVHGSGETEPLDANRRRLVLESAERMAEHGYRTLALAYRRLEGGPGPIEDLEDELVLVAIVGMSDEARPEASPAVREAQEAGIRVVMVTGDHEVTARAIAVELGILREGDDVMAGEVLRRLSADELGAEVDRYSVYARVDPADKVKIVEAWQGRGEIVAMTGDGVNDAPALRIADIGVAMGTGTDVAKDASSMVLADDNFATIISAVQQGRGIFANLRKVVHFLLAANASEVLLMFIGFLAFGFLGVPVLAVQLLWINLVTDGLPAIALGLDPPEPGLMAGAPPGDRSILSGRQQLSLLGKGAILATASLAMLVVGHYALDLPFPEVRTAVFTTLVLAQLLYAFVVRSERSPVWKRGVADNPWLLYAVIGSLLLQLAVVYTDVGQNLFDTVGLSAETWPWIIGLSLLAFAATALVAAAAMPRATTPAVTPNRRR